MDAPKRAQVTCFRTDLALENAGSIILGRDEKSIFAQKQQAQEQMKRELEAQIAEKAKEKAR